MLSRDRGRTDAVKSTKQDIEFMRMRCCRTGNSSRWRPLNFDFGWDIRSTVILASFRSDEIAHAGGKVIPSTQVQVVQNLRRHTYERKVRPAIGSSRANDVDS